MALDFKSRLTTGAFSGADGRELVRRIARHVLRLLLTASVACGGSWRLLAKSVSAAMRVTTMVSPGFGAEETLPGIAEIRVMGLGQSGHGASRRAGDIRRDRRIA